MSKVVKVMPRIAYCGLFFPGHGVVM